MPKLTNQKPKTIQPFTTVELGQRQIYWRQNAYCNPSYWIIGGISLPEFLTTWLSSENS